MKLKAGTEEGSKTMVFKSDGTALDLLMIEYDTETQVVKHYVVDQKTGQVKMGEWDTTEGNAEGKRKALVNDLHLPGSYAEVNGKRV